MSRFARAVDENQPAIVAALRAAGASVKHIHRQGDGCPDLLVGYRRVTHIMEIKRAGEGLTPAEEVWHRTWRGLPVAIVLTPEQALLVIGAVGQKKSGP